MKHLDLCSGIGGFALAASWVWPRHEVAAFVEIDHYCQHVLRKHWPGAPIHDDLKTFDARPFRGSIDLLTGGYPCQPFSHAGKRKGEADDRHLWPEVFRIIEECRPRWALFENVAGHVSMGLDSVLADLEGLDYTCEAAIIPACAVDAPHRRDRVWIVAHAEDAVAYSYSTGQQERHAATVTTRSRFDPRPSPAGWIKWSPESGLVRVADGVSNRVDRLRALGNAIVPQVAAEIMRAMKRAEAA